MNQRNKADRAQLVATARAIADELRANTNRTDFRMRAATQICAVAMDTDGWVARIGEAPGSNLWLEIWLDRYARHTERKFYAGFYAWRTDRLNRLARRVSRSLGPALAIYSKDAEDVGSYVLLKQRFRRPDFNRPVWEKYPQDGSYYFGIYDPMRQTRSMVDVRFKSRAVDFLIEVAAIHRVIHPTDTKHEVYPRNENRKLVAAHLARERSGYLAAERKRLDGYECAICRRTFEELYGEELGGGFAEAHHIRPLKYAGDRVRTRIEDLITVCSNCHRMLHRMSGRPEDVTKLRVIVRRHRRAWK